MKKWIAVIMIAAAMLFCSAEGHAQTAPPSVTLAWSEPTTGGVPTSYNILRTVVSGGENGTPIATVLPSASGVLPTTYTDSTGTPGSTYFYEVTASNAVGTSGPSNEIMITFLVHKPPPASPANLSGIANP